MRMPVNQEKQIMAELTHEQLWEVCQRMPGDYEPYGKRERLKGTMILSDCSGGCKWYHTLIGPRPWTGASAAIPKVIASDSSHSSIKAASNLSRSDLLGFSTTESPGEDAEELSVNWNLSNFPSMP
jgi:hypothetical protein